MNDNIDQLSDSFAAHEHLAPDADDGSTPIGDWTQLVGSASSVEFSPDKDQKYMYVINEIDEQVSIVDRAVQQVRVG